MRRQAFFLILTTLLCLLGTTELFAVGFEINPADESKRYLGLLFGSRVGPLSLGGAYNPIVIDLFEKFNVIVMLLAIGSLSYTAIGSVFSTSEEGDPLAKKFGSLWLPLRAAAGILLMFPTPQSGFCLIQVGLMWLVLQGVGAANQIWHVVLDSIESGFNIVGGVKLSDTAQKQLNTTINNMMPEMVRTITCIESLKAIQADPEKNPNPSAFLVEKGLSLNFYLMPFGKPNTSEGKFNDIGNTTPLPADQLTYTKKSFMAAGVKNLSDTFTREQEYPCGRFEITAIAEKENTEPNADPTREELMEQAEKRFLHLYLATESVYQSLRNFVSINIVNKEKNKAEQDRDSKITEMSLIAKNTLESTGNLLSALANPPVNQGPNADIQRAKEIGWIHAGSMYYKLNQDNPELSLSTDLMTPGGMPAYSDDPSSIPITDALQKNEIAFVEEKLKIADLYKDYFTVKDDVQVGSSLANIGTNLPSGVSEKFAAFTEGFPSVKNFNEFIAKFNSGAEPIGIIRDFGNDIMTSAEGIWAASFIAAFAAIATVAFFPSAIFSLAFAVKSLVWMLVTVITSAAMLLWSFGAILGIYIPMIPFLMFSVSAIGWFVAVIEGMVAGPILALGLVSATSDGSEELGKALPGVYILANIFMRPTLMIFGFILATRLLHAILTLVNTSLAEFLFQETGDGAFVIFAFGAKVGLYAGFVMAIVNKCFALIYILPNQVLKWMGAQQEGGFGEDQVLSGLKQKTQGSAQAAGSTLQGSASGAQNLLSKKSQESNQQMQRQNQQLPPQ